MITTREYEYMAMTTEAAQFDVLDRLWDYGVDAMRLDNGARGVASEAGELCGAVARYIEYGKPLDTTNVLEEVGDVLWRLTQVCKAVGITLEEAMEANIRKLAKRYPSGFTEYLAHEENRKRGEEKQAMEQAPARPTEANVARPYLVNQYTLARQIAELLDGRDYQMAMDQIDRVERAERANNQPSE